MFTLYARNRPADQKLDLYFLTVTESFALADDYFVISEHKSTRGGPFDKTAIRTKKVPAGLSTEQLLFVSEYFQLLAAQQLANAEGVGSPADPTFARSFPYKPRANTIDRGLDASASKHASAARLAITGGADPQCGYCGVAYQACCIGFKSKGYPCGCDLQDGGSGKAGEGCGDCGVSYAACCIGFEKEGDPCTCNVENSA